jgi:hypothetical protein
MLNVPRSTWALAAKLAVVAMLTVFVCVSPATASDSVITLDGTPIVVATTDPGETALVTFDGVAGQRVSLRAYASSMHLPTLTIQKPSGGNMFTPKTVNGLGLFVDPVTLPETGTYTIVADPPTSYVGSLTLAAWVVPPDTTDTVAIGGSTSVSIAAPGQNASLTFAGTAGGRVSMTVTNVTAANTVVQLKKPDGTNLGSAVTVRTTGAYIDPVTLPVTGTYTISINPPGANVGDLTFSLYDVAADQTGTLPIGSGPTPLVFAAPGQNGAFTFAGTAGQKVTLTVTDDSITQSTISIKKPGNINIASGTIKIAGGILGPVALPVTGTYTVYVDPYSSNTGGLTLNLFQSPPDLTGTLVPGTPQTLTFDTPGRNALLTFAGTAGQRLALNFNQDTISSTQVSVIKPAGGTVVTPSTFPTNGKFIEPMTLPATGTYTIKVDPQGLATGSIQVAVYNPPADIAQTATIGTPITVTTTAPGQNAKISFPGVAGTKASIVLSGITAADTPIGGITFSVLNPAGTAVVRAFNAGTAGKFVQPFAISTTGTYKLTIDPLYDNFGSVTATIYTIPADSTAPITLGGTPATATTTAPGQNARLTFSLASAKKVSFKMSNSTIGVDPFFGTKVSIVNTATNATVLTAFNVGSSDEFHDPVSLSAGNYAFVVDPQDDLTGSLTFQAYDVPADATATATVGGAAAVITTTVPGQNGKITFTGTVGQTRTVTIDFLTTGPGLFGRITVNRPSGTAILSTRGFMPGDSFTFTITQTGTQSIIIDPDLWLTGPYGVTVT